NNPREEVPAGIVCDDIAYAEIVAEAVSLHFLCEDFGRRAEFVYRFKFFGEMPLALVCGVISGVAHHVAERRKIGRQTADPRKIRIVEHLRILDMAGGIHDGSRRSTNA